MRPKPTSTFYKWPFYIWGEIAKLFIKVINTLPTQSEIGYFSILVPRRSSLICLLYRIVQLPSHILKSQGIRQHSLGHQAMRFPPPPIKAQKVQVAS